MYNSVAKQLKAKFLVCMPLIFLVNISASSQKLTLTDLTKLCSRTNWEEVNTVLLIRDWTYYDSKRGDSDSYNTITWSFNKDRYSDKANGWFYLYTYEGFPNKISYMVFNKQSYSLIQNSLTSAGFKLINSDIQDNLVESTYANASYILTISSEKTNDDEWSSSLTAYTITLIKKAGVYDDDNGKKTEYFDSGGVKAEYILLDGKLNGQMKVYHENGKLERIGNFINDKKNGLFKEYDEEGNQVVEYMMVNGKKNGLLKYYQNNVISYTRMFKDDVAHGEFIRYFSDKQTGKLVLKYIGQNLNGVQNGTWKLFAVEEGKDRLLAFESYSNGIKNGRFQKVQGDSLIVGSYKDDRFEGSYKVYRDRVKLAFGGIINSDTTELILTTEGNYSEGVESGYWRYYDMTRTLESEGSYLNGQKHGEWKAYYGNWTDDDGQTLHYAKALFLVETYRAGKLDGKAIRYSYLNQEKFPCSETDNNKSGLDTCEKLVYEKVLETSYYKDDKLNGPFELLDSTGSIFAKGFFVDDEKAGEWIQRYDDTDVNDNVYFFFQKGRYRNDKREGKWVEYFKENEIVRSFYCKNGELDGEYVTWNLTGKPRVRKQFVNGLLTQLITYDSLGQHKDKYEIYDERSDSYKCRRTQYTQGSFTSQEYWIQRNKPVDHNWFELVFLMAIDERNKNAEEAFRDGEFRMVNADSRPLTVGNFYKEERRGRWTFYFYDQNVKIESNYSGGNRIDEKYFTLNGDKYSGDFIYYDTDHNTKEERSIKGGVRNGKTVYIDLKTNKIIRKESFKNGQLN